MYSTMHLVPMLQHTDKLRYSVIISKLVLHGVVFPLRDEVKQCYKLSHVVQKLTYTLFARFSLDKSEENSCLCLFSLEKVCPHILQSKE